jgi:hypothetical protein
MNALGYGSATLDAQLNGSVFSKITPPGGNTLHIAEISGYAATRGREQQLFVFFKNGGATMGNQITPVLQYNPLSVTYHLASNLAFGPLVSYDNLYK